MPHLELIILSDNSSEINLKNIFNALQHLKTKFTLILNGMNIKEIRDFAGALLSKRSNKGVFITTSNFPSSAHEFVRTIDRKIILIDGERLAQLMIDFDLGVSIKEKIAIKEIDIDYFAT